MIVKDAEGANKFMAIRVLGAKNSLDAKRIVLKIANSNLVKTTVSGCNPNWGRILAAIGASGAEIREKKLKLYLGNELVFSGTRQVHPNRAKLKRIFKKPDISILVDLNMGKFESQVLTCDLSKKYVEINAKYPS